MGGVTDFAQSFGTSPIILVNGIASGTTGGMPISALLGEKVRKNLIGEFQQPALDNAFATFVPVPGGTLIDNAVGTYPFANQAIAGNAIIANGLKLSMRMICPVRDAGGYAVKLATITALQSSLAKHNNSGGTYTIATPSFFYESGLLILMTDTSDGESKQAQIEWTLDFYFPLLTLEAAAAAQNSLMSRITANTMTGGDPPTYSGAATTVGAPNAVGATSGGTVAPPNANAPVSI